MTSYLILARDAGSEPWIQGPAVEAVSSEAAIRKVISNGATDGEYVAVPVRSFQIVRVTIETKRTVKLDGAGEEPEVYVNPKPVAAPEMSP